MGEVTDALRKAGHAPNRARRETDAPAEIEAAPVKISRAADGAWRARTVLVDPPSFSTDQFRHFALRVRQSLEERGVRSVLITSPVQGEGKTLVATNLALALASMAGEGRIALLDLDLHHPSVAHALGIDPGVGVERVLLGEAKLRAARVRTDVPALDVYPIGRPVPRAHEILARSVLPTLVDDLCKQYTTVVCDGPPALAVSDVALIAPHIGGCVVVAKARSTRRLPFAEAVARLPRERIIGTFLNFWNPPRHTRQYTGYSYYADAEDSADGGDAVEGAAEGALRATESAPGERLDRSDD